MVKTRVCVVGGGPAGLVLGLVLARAGVDVTVLEKHADFLRDFRGDTVHASTLTLLDELGLHDRFARLPQRSLERVEVELDGGTATVGDLTRLPGRNRRIALVPQWDLLEMLADAAAEEPSFALRREAEVVGLLTDGTDGTNGDGTVTGVRYVDRSSGARPDEREHELGADLVVACDGRDSTVRRAAGLRTREFGLPMDVEWFRLPRHADDPAGLRARLAADGMVVLIDRGDYWQCAFLVRKGDDATLRAAGLAAFGRRVGRLVPWLANRAAVLASWDDVRLLSVSLDRLRRWYRPGLLLVGDAAHAMSPVGGVGINLAVQDAVATARVVGDAVRAGRPLDVRLLRRVQLRRWWPTAVVQTAQRIGHRVVIRPAVATAPDAAPRPGGHPDGHPDHPARLPLGVRLLDRFPALRALPARAVAIGPLPEHAPRWARRTGAVRTP